MSDRAKIIERLLLDSVTYSDDAQRLSALQYISNRAFNIAESIDAALNGERDRVIEECAKVADTDVLLRCECCRDTSLAIAKVIRSLKTGGR